MALFRRSNNSLSREEAAKAMSDFAPNSQAATKTLAKAREAAESRDPAAMTFYCNALREDPYNQEAWKAMIALGLQHQQEKGKTASKEECKKLDGTHPLDKFVVSYFKWCHSIQNLTLAKECLESAIISQQIDFVKFSAERVLNIASNNPKTSRANLIATMELVREAGCFDIALEFGRLALKLKSDPELDRTLKQLSAEHAMKSGGFNEVGNEAGSFRKNIKDAKKQQEILEEGSLGLSEDSEDRQIKKWADEFKKDPSVPDTISKYGQLLKRSGSAENLKIAYKVYMKGFETTKEYRFKMAAGDIKIQEVERQLSILKSKCAKHPEDSSLQNKYNKGLKQVQKIKMTELSNRIHRFPGDRSIRFALGVLAMDMNEIDKAMECFQKSKDEPKLRVDSGHKLGLCFDKEGWHAEAVAELKETLDNIEVGDNDRSLNIQYDLMKALIKQSKSEKNITQATEALKICSSIARKDISYKDIRIKRREIDSLIKELS